MAYNFTNSFNSNLYVTDSSIAYTTDGNVTTNYAGVWDGTTGTSGWSTLDGGINSGYARGTHIVSSSRIYLYGSFSSIGSTVTVSHGSNFSLAMWDGTKWNSVGTLGTTSGVIHEVFYDVANDLLYAVGTFTSIYGVSANRVAVYNGTSWSALQGGSNSNLYSCAVDDNGDLYVGGAMGGLTNSSFVSNTSGAAKWDKSESEWVSLGGTNNSVYSVRYVSDDNCVYFGGSFSSMNSVSNTKLIAKYDITTSTWSSVGTFNSGSDSVIYSMEIGSDGALYVAGEFVSNGTDVAYRNSSGDWTDLGAGDYSISPTLSNFQPIDITVDSNGNAFVARNAGGLYILKYGTTTWEKLNSLTSNIDIGNQLTNVSIPDITPSTTSESLTVDTAMTNITFTNTGGLPTFTVSPTLPTGLSINSLNGTISGTPTVIAIDAITYTITATNSGGTDSATISLSVRDAYINSALTNNVDTSVVNNMLSVNLPSSVITTNKNLNTIVNLNLSLNTETNEATKRSKRKSLLDLVFSRSTNTGKTAFITPSLDIGLPTHVKENCLVYKSNQSIDLETVDSKLGVFINISDSGETATFQNVGGSQTVIFTAGGDDTYTATVDGTSTGNTYYAGSTYIISGYNWIIGSVYTDGGSDGNICFGRDTDILTTKGYIPVWKLNKDYKILINRKIFRIICVTKRRNPLNILVLFRKHSLGMNLPFKDTFITHNHKLFYENKWTEARDFVNNDNIIFAEMYDTDEEKYIYNVLLKNRGAVKANGIIVESLDPENETATSHIYQ